MLITGLEKSFGKKAINESYRSIQIGTPLSRTTSTSVLECHQRPANLPVWQPPILEVEYRLPTVVNPKTDSAAFRSISADTLHKLLTTRTEQEFNKEFILLDCRYNYEFNGGHIKYAVNFYDNTQVHTLFYPDDPDEFDNMNSRVPIFYCEYSQVRGPKMAHELRRFDRRRNEASYPIVDYPEIYLLEGDIIIFINCLKKRHGLCVPDKYIPMKTKKFSSVLKKFSSHRLRTQNIAKHCCLQQDSLVIRRKRRGGFLENMSSIKKIQLNAPMMTSTPRAEQTTSLVENEMKRIQIWRSDTNSFPSTSEWDSSFETSLTELDNSVLEERSEVSITNQSQAIMNLDLDRSSPLSFDTIAPKAFSFDSDVSSVLSH
uniref:Protein-tyrosine-phosphatase n=1 Tax=Panagrolaimus sp. JU765 TaxID=591449 RepID=A0AC34RCA4_9BILA